jgi:hypothetical protein
MNLRNARSAHMQREPGDDVQRAFGAAGHGAVHQNGVRVATPLVGRPCLLTVPVASDHLIVSARVYGVGGGAGWTLRLTVDGERRAGLAFDKSDSAQLVASVSNAFGPVHIAFEAEELESGVLPRFNSAHFGVLWVAS